MTEQEAINLCIDARKVHEATGLTPSQLQARVAELETALRTAIDLAREDCSVEGDSPLWLHLRGFDA